MKYFVLTFALAFFTLAGSVSVAYAQQQPAAEREAPLMRIVLVDGSSVVGTIQSETPEAVLFLTASGVELEIPRSRIQSMKRAAGAVVDGAFVPHDPNATRLLFAPTARPIGDGRGYVAAYQVFFPFVGYGAGDIASLAGGVSLIPGLSGQFVYLAPKATVYNRRGRAAAVGVLAVTGLGADFDNAGFAGLFYGVGTFGNTKRAITVGAGWGFAEGEVADRPVIMVGGEYQLGSSVKLISENYIVPGIGEAVAVSGGIRFFGERLAADLALVTSPSALDDLEDFPFVPWLGFAYNFGR